MSAQDDFETGWTSGGWMDDSPMSNEPLPPPPPPPALAFTPMDEPIRLPEKPASTPKRARKPAARKAAPRKPAKKARKASKSGGKKAAKRAPAKKKATRAPAKKRAPVKKRAARRPAKKGARRR
jgi:hypothetical protein